MIQFFFVFEPCFFLTLHNKMIIIFFLKENSYNCLTPFQFCIKYPLLLKKKYWFERCVISPTWIRMQFKKFGATHNIDNMQYLKKLY